MVSWGVADFLAKKAIDQIGYRISIVINQAVAFIPILLIAALFFKLPSFTPLLAGEAVLAGVTGVIGYIFLLQRFRKRQRLCCRADHRQLVSHNRPACSVSFRGIINTTANRRRHRGFHRGLLCFNKPC